MELKLLHFSDIHFKNFGEKDHLDGDADIRGELEFDLENVIRENGSVNAILISGDIAFSGKEDEYDKATEWLKHICNLSGCENENVFPVPGNHDIERRKIGVMLKTTQEKFKNLRNRTYIDSELNKYLFNDPDLTALLSPLENYYNFAQKYDAIPHKNYFYWEKDLTIDNATLRIRGMNSTLISNESDDEHESKLILGSHQTTLKREKGIVYLTICHHPTQWLYDGDDVENDLVARARIQLFGHKHIFRFTKINNSLRLSAGALHPSRQESGWEPRYNMLGISIFEKEKKKYLKVRIWERIWDNDNKKFVAKYVEGGEKYSEETLELDEQESQILQLNEEDMDPKKPEKKEEKIEQIDLTKPDPVRKLAYLFFELPYHNRMKIATELKLIEDSDEHLNPILRSQNYFKKAMVKNLLRELWDQVALYNIAIKSNTNPFKDPEENK
jgi:predicted phosphodiesterase